MSDFDVILNYLPPEGHPQDVVEDDCPYCALRRIEAELAALKGRHVAHFVCPSCGGNGGECAQCGYVADGSEFISHAAREDGES